MAGKPQKHPDDLVFRRGGRVREMVEVEVAVNDRGERLDLIPPSPDGDAMVERPQPVPSCPDFGVREWITEAEAEAARAYAAERWRLFWLSPISKVATLEAHGEALYHWIRPVHQRAWMGSSGATRRSC